MTTICPEASETQKPPTTIRRARVAVALCAVVLSVLSVAALGPSRPAGAMDIGGIGALAQVPGVNYGTAGCTRGFVSVTPRASVDNHYTGGQYMSYRIHVFNDRGLSQTYGFAAPKLIPHNGYHDSPLPSTYINAQLSSRYWIYVQVARYRWNGTSWGWQYMQWQEASYTGYSGVAINQCFT